jgi:hypothetical protein
MHVLYPISQYWSTVFANFGCDFSPTCVGFLPQKTATFVGEFG